MPVHKKLLIPFALLRVYGVYRVQYEGRIYKLLAITSEMQPVIIDLLKGAVFRLRFNSKYASVFCANKLNMHSETINVTHSLHSNSLDCISFSLQQVYLNLDGFSVCQ